MNPKHFLTKCSFYIFTGLILVINSCGKKSGDVVYSHFETINSSGWDPADVIFFEPWPADSVVTNQSVFSLDMVVRSSSRHELPSFPLQITMEDENGVIKNDTLMIDLNQGNKENTKENPGIKEIRLNLEQSLMLKEGYAVSISPLTQKSKTKGLLNIGLILKRQ